MVTLGKAGDLGSFLGRCSGKAAPSGACAVLVTDKASTPPLLKALAAELGGKMGFAIARKGALDLVPDLGLTRCNQGGVRHWPAGSCATQPLLHALGSACMCRRTALCLALRLCTLHSHPSCAPHLRISRAEAPAERSVPSLAVVCNGNLGTVDVYQGDLKAQPLRSYLNGFASGSKCSSMVQLDCSTDLGSWRAGKLKQARAELWLGLHLP